MNFKKCDEKDDMECITYHKLHCPACDSLLTSLLLCPDCGVRYVQCLYTIWSISTHPICGHLAEFNWKGVPVCKAHSEMIASIV